MSWNLKGWNVLHQRIKFRLFNLSTFKLLCYIWNYVEKGDPKIIRAWTFYDWANSVYPLVISSAIFPIFYEKKPVTFLEVN